MNTSQVVVILTIGRSGSSAIAGALHTLGIHMGEHMGKVHPSNEKGPFEDRAFMIFSEKYLTDRNKDWYDSYGIENSKPTAEDVSVFKKLVTSKCDKPFWGWKNPRTLAYIKHLYKYVPNPFFIWIYRDVAKFCNSLNARDSIPMDVCKKIYKHYERLYFDFKDGTATNRLIEIDFGQFVRSPREILKVICHELRFSFDNAKLEEAARFVEPKLKHW